MKRAGIEGTFHKFALNGDYMNPECNSIQGVEAAYWNALNHVNLLGPTHFADIISAINDRVESVQVSQWNQEYHVLLIITDGAITD